MTQFEEKVETNKNRKLLENLPSPKPPNTFGTESSQNDGTNGY